MKIEFDPNELTAVQRSHVANFIEDWPVREEGLSDDILDGLKDEIRNHRYREFITTDGRLAISEPTEAQRLHEEQTADLKQPDAAPSFADVAASMIAPVDTTVTTSQAQIVPPPPVQNSAPSVETAAPATDSPAPLVDKEGLPWDSRIHSSSKALVADGTWRLKRGADPQEVVDVKAELRSRMIANPGAIEQFELNVKPTQFIPPPPAATFKVTPPPKPHYLIDQPGVQIEPIPITMNDLIGRISAAIANGKFTKEQVTEICNKHGVMDFALLSGRPELLPVIDNELKAMGV